MRDPLLLSYPTSTSSSDSLYPDVEEALTFDHLLPKPPKAFDPRTVRNHRFSLNAKYMICTLRSYPLRMLPGKPRDLPSFIHPQCMSYISRDDRMIHDSHSSPLENCLAIMQVWSVKSKGNSSFIWRTIRMEQERLLSEYLQYDDRNTVAGLQAITVYILLRLSDDDDDDATDIDLPLIHSMIKLALRTSGIIMKYAHSSDGGNPSWEDWVLVESLRRTLIVLFLVDVVFDFGYLLHPYKCDGSELLDMALPCGRNLWQASDRSEWEREYAQRGASKQFTYGDLLNSRFTPDRALDSWLEQLDDFGNLVMAAASLRDM